MARQGLVTSVVSFSSRRLNYRPHQHASTYDSRETIRYVCFDSRTAIAKALLTAIAVLYITCHILLSVGDYGSADFNAD